MVGEFIAHLLEPLVDWLLERLPKGCLIGGCLGTIILLAVLWIVLASARA